MKELPASLAIEEIREWYANRQPQISNRLKEFARVPKPEYFYELIYCLLTPQSSAVNAEKAIRLLRNNDFQNRTIEVEPLLHQKEFYIRFHKTKAKHLLLLKEDYPIIAQHLTNGSASIELRMWLVKNVNGLGWKEASHVLRNIGHRDLAILDRHILKNLVRAGVLKQLPKTLTAKWYLRIEQQFLAFSKQIGISMDELDLLFWSMETGEVLK